MLLAGLVASAVGGMVQDEIRMRLTRIPYGVLRLAAFLVPPDQRDDLRTEWRAELSAIVEETKDVPFTGLLRATWYALGVLARGRAVARELDGTATERRRQLLDLLTRVKRRIGALAGWLSRSGTRRQIMTVSTPAGTIAVTGRAALAASAALTAAAAGITASVLAGSGSPPGPAFPGSSLPRTEWDPRTGSPVDVAFSPDGKILAAGNSDGTVRLWDVAIGRLFRLLTDRTRVRVPACSTARSPDGMLLAVRSLDGTVQLWEVIARPLGRPVELWDTKPRVARSGSFPANCGCRPS